MNSSLALCSCLAASSACREAMTDTSAMTAAASSTISTMIRSVIMSVLSWARNHPGSQRKETAKSAAPTRGVHPVIVGIGCGNEVRLALNARDGKYRRRAAPPYLRRWGCAARSPDPVPRQSAGRKTPFDPAGHPGQCSGALRRESIAAMDPVGRGPCRAETAR
jgi:hypothetical protein